MQAHATLYHRYSLAMYHTCLRIVNNPADAEDILQEAFLQAFKSLEKLNDQNAFAGWIKRIVINRSIDFLRRRQKSLLVHKDLPEYELPQEEEAIDEAMFAGKVSLIRQALDTLPDKYRLVMNLHVFEKMSFEQVADLLNIPSATVRSQYLRARQKIIAQLKATKQL